MNTVVIDFLQMFSRIKEVAQEAKNKLEQNLSIDNEGNRLSDLFVVHLNSAKNSETERSFASEFVKLRFIRQSFVSRF